jgi:hypothetical protein
MIQLILLVVLTSTRSGIIGKVFNHQPDHTSMPVGENTASRAIRSEHQARHRRGAREATRGAKCTDGKHARPSDFGAPRISFDDARPCLRGNEDTSSTSTVVSVGGLAHGTNNCSSGLAQHGRAKGEEAEEGMDAWIGNLLPRAQCAAVRYAPKRRTGTVTMTPSFARTDPRRQSS